MPGNRSEVLTPMERVMKVVAMQAIDRIPVFCQGRFGDKFFGYTEKQVTEDVAKYVEVEVGVLKEFGGDSVTAGLFCGEIEEELGSSFERLDDNGPKSMITPLLTDSKQRGKLRRALDKLDFSKNEALARALNRIETLKHAVGKEIPLLTWISAPFRSLCMLRGIENTFIDMHKNPGDVRAIDLWLAWGDACMDAGADIIWSSNPTASGLCISRNFYEEFVHPFCIQFYGAYRQKGYPIFFHPCGEWGDRFDLLCREGYHVLHLDNVDLADFKRTWGHEVGIWGNIKTVDTFLIGNPDKVREEAVACMLKASAGGGFILGANCDIPRDTPPENVHAMVTAAREFQVAVTT
jgi:uroporphyrinogen decarboxylase